MGFGEFFFHGWWRTGQCLRVTGSLTCSTWMDWSTPVSARNRPRQHTEWHKQLAPRTGRRRRRRGGEVSASLPTGELPMHAVWSGEDECELNRHRSIPQGRTYVDPAGVGGDLTLWNRTGHVLTPPPKKKCHSFIQNCCWITLQDSHHKRWDSCVKNGR